MFGHWELIALLAVVLLIFGPSQLPRLAKAIGKSIQSFRGGIREAQEEKSPPEIPAPEAKKELPEQTKTEG